MLHFVGLRSGPGKRQGVAIRDFGHVDFATTVAAEVTEKSDEFNAAFALGRRGLGAVEKLDL